MSQKIHLDVTVSTGNARKFLMRWVWAVYNPNPYIPHPNYVAGGRTLTVFGAFVAAHVAVRLEKARYRRYWRRNGYRPQEFEVINWLNNVKQASQDVGTP